MSDFPEKAEDKVNTFGVMLIGLATTVLLWASVIALQAAFQNTSGEVKAEREAQGLTAGVRDLDARQRADLAKTVYADPGKGTLKRLAIEQAKAAVVAAGKDGSSMVPSLGELNVPTIPAVAGKPADDAKIEPVAPAPVEDVPSGDGALPEDPSAEADAPVPASAPAAEAAPAGAP